MALSIKDSTFTIVANGFADGPSQALRDYLNSHKAKRVITVSHPLVPEGDNHHIIIEYSKGKQVNKKSIKLPNKPPYTYAFDSFVPLKLPKDDVWFGFNNLACQRGLLRRKIGRTKKVVYWAVDFFPDRFGQSPATKAYNFFDSIVCRKSDSRVELTQSALEKRPEYLGIDKTKLSPSLVIPMGAWLKRTPKTTEKSWAKKKVVYLGHLVDRQGVKTFIDAVHLLKEEGIELKAEIIGAGPLEEDLKKQTKKIGLKKTVTFHGFVKSHEKVESILADATIAVAPYQKDPNNFTQFSDSGKLKAYMGASLPIVMTDVPPNSNELVEAGVVEIANDSPKDFARVIGDFLKNNKKWSNARKASAKKAQEFDWDFILKTKLKEIGIE